MSHQPEQMPEDMAIDLWLQTLNDELNEMLARDGRDDVTDMLQQRYSILKRLAIASAKRDPLSDECIDELALIAFGEYMEDKNDDTDRALARAIEQAHGITKEKE